MTVGIYCYYDNLRCEIVYVGKDSYIDKNKRHRQHYQPSKKNKQIINKILQNNNKSGRYSYAVLEQGDFTDDELNQKEISWITFFSPFFNFTEGGEGIRGYKHSDETRKKISEANSGKNHPFYETKRSKETCEKISKNNPRYWKDKKRSKETRKKMSKAKSGENNPQFNPYIKIKKQKDKTCKQGFYWRARPRTSKKQITLSNVDLQKCIEKVEKFINSEENTYGYDSYEVID